MARRIRADRELCASSGMCALTAPDVFDQDSEDGRVVVLEATPGSEVWEDVREAVSLCPSGALAVDEEE